MDGAPGQRGWSRPVVVAAIVVLAVAFAFRVHALGRLPGINGDEAWYGVFVQRLAHVGAYAWLTPSGNPPAPFQLGWLALLSRFARPSFALLRVPAVLASLAQLALTFVVARRHLGRDVALVAVLLTAALPIEIAYARFGWDPSHAGLVAVVALHFALVGRAPAVFALFALAVWAHPTNVFLAPWLVATLVFGEVDWRRVAPRAAVIAAATGGGLLVALAAAGFVGGSARAAAIVWRVVDPRQWARFALAFVRLLDGDTVFTFITGTGYGAARWAVDLPVAALIAAVAVRGARRLADQPRKLGLVVGWLATLVTFFVFAGPAALAPHVERYGLCLVVPTIVALSILVVEALPGSRAALVVALLAVALLGAFWRRYFVALETTGSTSHETFWTGPVEPKAEAFRRIELAAGGRPARVLADGYWLFWPLAYLADGTALEVREAEAEGAGSDARPAGGVYCVGFPGGAVDAWARRTGASLRWELAGPGGRIELRVWELPRE